MAFYRTYRPSVIAEIDNEHVREQLLRLLTKDKKDLPHAYFFSGPRGTGKTTAARLIAKLFNCQKPKKSGEPCGTCDQCTAIGEGTAVDIVEIDAASNTGVDNIRDLRNKIILAPSESKWKIYIIDEVHMLSTGAFNALLKTLEEPPAHAVFILATTDPQKVPITVKSRCMVLAFRRPTEEEITHALDRIVKREKINIDKKALALIAQAADGSFRDGVKKLEQVSFSKKKIDEKVVRDILNMPEGDLDRDMLVHLSEKNVKGALAHIEQTAQVVGDDFKTYIDAILTTLEEEVIAQAKGEKTTPLTEDKKHVAKFTIDELTDLIRRFQRAYKEMKGATIPQLPLELAVIEYCLDIDDQATAPPSKPAPTPASKPSSTPESKPATAPKQPTTKPAAPKPAAPAGSASNTPDVPEPARNASSTADAGGPKQIHGSISLEKLVDHWPDVIAAMKPYNHSVAGVLRSTRPKSVDDGTVIVEAFYAFHQEKLSEPGTLRELGSMLHKLFGEKVTVNVTLGKK